jgi:hypothetical protein
MLVFTFTNYIQEFKFLCIETFYFIPTDVTNSKTHYMKIALDKEITIDFKYITLLVDMLAQL